MNLLPKQFHFPLHKIWSFLRRTVVGSSVLEERTSTNFKKSDSMPCNIQFCFIYVFSRIPHFLPVLCSKSTCFSIQLHL